MDTIIVAPASCEVCAVIRFLGQRAAEIRRWLCHVYGDNVTSDSCVVREWCRKFRDGCTDMHDESGHTQLWLMNSFKKSTNACVENVDSQYQNFLKNFHKFRGLLCIELSRTNWVTISSVHDGYQNNWLTFTKLKEWGQPWRFFSTTG